MKKTAKTLAKQYDWDDVSLFFGYILESYFCGQLSQSKKLFLDLNKADKKAFFDYLFESGMTERDTKFSLQYFLKALFE